VPDLEQTLNGYLDSLEPIIEDASELRQCKKSLREKRMQWAEEFKHGIGRVCQERLKGLIL